MNKTELIDTISESINENKAVVGRILDQFATTVTSQLQSGEQVVWPNFVTISAGVRAAREGRNPATGETIQIKAARVAKFKPGKGLKEALNEGFKG